MDIFNLISNIFRYEIFSGSSIKITLGTIFFVVILFFITHFLLKLFKRITLKYFITKNKGQTKDSGRVETVFNFIGYFVYVIVLFSILSAIGVNINMFLTATAAIFVGLGFALQQIFQDLIAGIYILLDRTLNVGDIIQIDNKVARINVINLRSTIAETRDRRIIVIPNRMFINDIVHNWTQDHNIVRAVIDVRAYNGSDVVLVRDILLESVKNVPKVLKEYETSVIIDDFGESAILFRLRYYIDDAYNNDVIASDIRFEIDRLFKENGIKLPVPVLHLDSPIIK